MPGPVESAYKRAKPFAPVDTNISCQRSGCIGHSTREAALEWWTLRYRKAGVDSGLHDPSLFKETLLAASMLADACKSIAQSGQSANNFLDSCEGSGLSTEQVTSIRNAVIE